MREHALAPWVLDIQLNPGSARRWVFKRERTVIGTLDDVTWVAPDGLRYLQPELVLARGSMSRAKARPTPGGRCWMRRGEERPGRLTAPRTLFATPDPSASPLPGQAPGFEVAGPDLRAASTPRCRG